MKKIYGLQNDKEKISLIIVDDKPLLIIQTAESFKVSELNLQYDKEDLEEITTVRFKPMGFSSNYDGAKIYSANKENQPEPLQKALKRIKELERVTDVRIDEEFKATDFNASENRLTITIDYLDVDIVKEMEKADKYKLY
ncbi:hypothetical protein [Aerococcus urinaeequi]|uniref:hypothetical protein n=1 Tax=Aerococcus urinaeequi TaxID=51665 RepID=UPI003D6BA7ED